MPRNPRTPLSATAKEALEYFTDAIPDREEQGCPRDEAHQFLVDHETFSQEQAERAIHQLVASENRSEFTSVRCDRHATSYLFVS
jgi:hypothetical protein